MKLIHIFFFSIFFFPSNLNACCGPEFYSLSELLTEQDDHRGIFVCRIDSLYLNQHKHATASVTITEGFRGKTKNEKAVITAFGYNLKGLKNLKLGERYLIIGYSHDGQIYGPYSCELYYKSIVEAKSEIKLFRSFFKKKNSNYSGKIKVKNGKQILATGKMKNGILHGNWKHYYSSGKEGYQYLALDINYENGVFEGEYKRFRKSNILTESSIYKNGQITQRETYMTQKGKHYLYRKRIIRNGKETVIIYKPDGSIEKTIS